MLRRALLLSALLAAGLSAQEATHLESGDCRMCHTRIRTPAIGQHPLWTNSMMARAGRDPYWRMRVEREKQLLPNARALIDEKCFRCHTPAAGDLGIEAGSQEGVTCTVCHRITGEGFGSALSFTGGFRFNPKKEIAGPHEHPFQMPMLMHTTMAPVASAHVLRPELCATCHTVITPILDAQGRSRGDFYEQTPYLEWRASDGGGTGLTCQQCHMPDLEEEEYIAHRPPGGPFPPTRPRKPFARHEFTGGNVQVLERSGGNADTTRRRLEGAVNLKAEAAPEGGAMVLRVTLSNMTGHKLPTGFPGRRLWLRVTGWDQTGRELFSSGGPGTNFRQPHRNWIAASGEAMVWEARMKGPSLLLDAAWEKDNRILPSGFDASRVRIEGVDGARLAPVGVGDDSDFLPGSDQVGYRLPARTARIRVEACFLSAPELGEDPPTVLAAIELRPANIPAANVRRD